MLKLGLMDSITHPVVYPASGAASAVKVVGGKASEHDKPVGGMGTFGSMLTYGLFVISAILLSA